MSYLYSRALVEEYLEENFSDGKLSVRLKSTPMPQVFLSKDKMTKSWNLFQYGMIFQHLTENHGKKILTWYLEDFLVRTSQQREKGPELPEKEVVCGEKWRGSFAKWNLLSSSWKTHLCSLFGDWIEFSGIWPRWGTMRNGVCWERKTSELHTSVNESGFSDSTPLFPTPTKNEAGKSKKTPQMTIEKKCQMTLDRLVQIFPTPCKWDALKNAHKLNQEMLSKVVFQEEMKKRWDTPCKGDAHPRAMNRTGPYHGKGQKHLQAQAYECLTEADMIGGQLNPEWVEWLMGWPIGWTELCALETDKFQEWQKAHGNFSFRECFRKIKSKIKREDTNKNTLI